MREIRSLKTVPLIFAATVLTFAACAPKAPPSPTIAFANDDRDMLAAIEKARGLLPHFWKTFDSPTRGEHKFRVQVRMAEKNKGELLWLDDISHNSGKVSGTVSDTPTVIQAISRGQRVTVPDAQVTDWVYSRDDKFVGAYTIRAGLRRAISPESVEALNSAIVDP